MKESAIDLFSSLIDTRLHSPIMSLSAFSRCKPKDFMYSIPCSWENKGGHGFDRYPPFFPETRMMYVGRFCVYLVSARWWEGKSRK